MFVLKLVVNCHILLYCILILNIAFSQCQSLKLYNYTSSLEIVVKKSLDG